MPPVVDAAITYGGRRPLRAMADNGVKKTDFLGQQNGAAGDMMMRAAGTRSAGCGALAVAFSIMTVVTFASAAPVAAQELSEKSVRTFMDYAWSLVPQQFTPPNGKTVLIDKSKKDENTVPIEIAREIIRVGRLSAHAQVCELQAEQVANYRSMMARELEKKKWTQQQLVYINQLHLTTVMLLTGKIKVIEKNGDKEVVVQESKANTQTCSAEQKQRVVGVITEYVKAGPQKMPKTASGQ